MAAPVYATGQVIDAPDVNSWFTPLAAIKTSDQPVTSSTTMISDSQLSVTPEVSASYFLTAYIWYQAGTVGDFKFQWGVPTGAFIRYMALYSGLGAGFGAKQTN